MHSRSEQISTESMATEQEQLQALTAQVQQLTNVMMDMDRRDAQEIEQRDMRK